MSHMEPIRLSSADAIRRAAIELFSANPGTSLAEVAARAGVGRATLHRHFPSRDDLIRDLAITALDATDAVKDDFEDHPDARVALARMFELLVPLGDRFHFLARCHVDDPEVIRRYDAQVDDVRELVARLRSQGHLAADVPDAWAIALADSLIWTAWTAAASGAVSAKDTGALAARTFLRGLGAEESP